MSIRVKLQVFEGPLDLLLHLIDKNKVNIYDIPISMITEQYMEYVDALKDEDLDVVSEFLVMAATLLDIKAKMLLPREVNEEGEEEDPRKELVEKLLEYKLYKAMAMELKDRQLDANRLYYRKENIPKEVKEYTPPINLDEVVKDLDLTKLNAIFNDVLRRKEDKIDPVRSKFGKIEKEEVSMSEKLVDIKAYMKNYSEFSFRELLDANSSKVAVIVTFLVILELIKTGFVTVTQASAQDDIFIKVINDPDLIEDIEED
ncbi:segregation and condensation protein A [Lachnospira multipara]|uniref:segregation and condensation protein A n=1 Tax=Lachnospira multipara TaxID=28051 RepID=UPI0004855DA6|nr:segregation/condensation protein A [Lachnospira multipara]